MKTGVEFGWGAPPMVEQFPALPSEEALAFDADNVAMIRLHVRGVISDSELRSAVKRLTKRIEGAVIKALGEPSPILPNPLPNQKVETS